MRFPAIVDGLGGDYSPGRSEGSPPELVGGRAIDRAAFDQYPFLRRQRPPSGAEQLVEGPAKSTEARPHAYRRRRRSRSRSIKVDDDRLSVRPNEHVVAGEIDVVDADPVEFGERFADARECRLALRCLTFPERFHERACAGDFFRHDPTTIERPDVFDRAREHGRDRATGCARGLRHEKLGDRSLGSKQIEVSNYVPSEAASEIAPAVDRLASGQHDTANPAASAAHGRAMASRVCEQSCHFVERETGRDHTQAPMVAIDEAGWQLENQV